MVSLSRLGTILLGIWAIFAGVAQLGIFSLPGIFMGLLLLIAGICLVAAQLRVTA